MRKVLRTIGNCIFYGTVTSIFAGAVLTATHVVALPLMVISGSMEPEITTGSAVISIYQPASAFEPGDIASFPREDGVLVTHRVVSNTQAGENGLRSVIMKGDANKIEDKDPYVQSEGLKPIIVIPVVGYVMIEALNHKLEILTYLVALMGIGLLCYVVYLTLDDRKKPRRKSLEVKVKAGDNKDVEV